MSNENAEALALIEGTRTAQKLDKFKQKIEMNVQQVFNIVSEEFEESPGAKHTLSEYLNTAVKKILDDAYESAKYVPGNISVSVPSATLTGEGQA